MRKLLVSCLAGSALLAAAVTYYSPFADAHPLGHGETSSNVNMLISAAKDSTYAYDITESLTTEIGPRVGGSPEEALAREWAVNKFKEIGLKNVRIETFKMPYWERGIETASIVSPFPQPLYITSLGVVIRSVGTDSRRFPHTGMMRYAEDVKKIPIAALSAPDADQLERTLSRGKAVKIKMTLTPAWRGEVESGNVIGEIPGSSKADEIVLVGAHLDSWDLGTGAVDDGAGIGITAGAAQVIIESGLKPKRTLRVVAFGAEEVGLLGGFAYANAHKDTDLDKHVLATESDFGATPPYEVKASVRSGRAVVEEMAKAMALPMSGLPTNGGPDIGPMSRLGVPTMRWQQDGTDYFDLHHTPDDTFDKINADDMAVNTAAFATMMWMASEAETDFRGDK